MTLYKLIKETEFEGIYKIHTPWGQTETFEDCIVMSCLIWDDPAMLTLDVAEIDRYMGETGIETIEVTTKCGEYYCSNIEEDILGSRTTPTIEEAVNILGLYAKPKEDITLGEIYKIEQMAHVTTPEIFSELGW